MGLEKLSVGARSALLEIGRMAYGSREGAKGGKGHIGLLNADGQPRVIKFDTHGGATGGDSAVQSGNDMRKLLVTISQGAGLPSGTLKEIRKALGLPPNGDIGAEPPTGLLDRAATAKVVELIGGKEIWKEVEASFDKSEYKSRGDTSFESVANQPVGEDTNNAKTLEKVETVTAETLEGRFEDLERLLEKLAGECPGMNLAAARRLLRRTLTDGDAINAMLVNLGSLKAATEDDLSVALVKMLVNIAVANHGDADVNAMLKFLNLSLLGESRPGLTFAYCAGVKLNAELLDWCGKNAAVFGVENADDMKAAVLQRLFEQDLRGASPDYTVATEKITFGDKTIEVKGTRNGLDALKAALGVDQPKKGAFTVLSGSGRATNFRKEFDRTRIVERDGVKYTDEVYPAYRKFLNPQRIRNTADLAQKITDRCMEDFRKRYEGQTLAQGHGFEDEFLREMTSSDKVGVYTIDGKPVPTSRLVRPKSLPLGDTDAIKDGSSTYRVKTAEGSAQDVSADSLTLMAAIEKLVPDAQTRFLLTMIIGQNEPVAGLIKDDPAAFGISKRDAENVLAAQTGTGCRVTELLDASTRRFDLSVEHGRDGDYAVVKEYVNVSPTFGSIDGVKADSTNGGAGISLAENWVEVTFKIRMGGENAGNLLIEENAAPTLTTSVRQLGVDPLAKRTARENIMQFVAEAKAHGNQAGYYLKLSADGIGLTSAGSRNIFRGSVSRTENNEVRARLKNLITAYYGSKYAIPPLVQQAMTNFTGEGNPLSAERVDKIWRAMEVDRVLSMSPEEFMKDPEAAFVLADSGGSLIIPDEWRQELKEHGYDLSEKALAKGLKTRQETARNTTVTLNVSKALAEMVKSGDLVHSGKQWAKDVSRCSVIRIGDTDFNASEYYLKRIDFHKGNGDLSQAKELAERDVELEVTNRLVRFISKGRYGDVAQLQDSPDEKMKKLLFFAKAHMDQYSLGEAANAALTSLNVMGTSKHDIAYGVQFGADGGLVFSHSDLRDFTKLDYAMETGGSQSLEVDLEEGRRWQAIKMSYSKGQLDGILNSDFNNYAEKYDQFNPNGKFTPDEKAMKDDDLVRKNRVDRFNGEIDPNMILRPEVKVAYTITAVEQPEDPDALEAEDRIRVRDTTEGRIVSYLADKLNIQRAGEEDMNLAITDPAKVDGSGDLNHACRKKAFSYETGSSSAVADKVAAKHPDERIGVQIYGDGTYAHCGFVANTNGQEEDTAKDLNPKGMAHLLAKKFVRKCAQIKKGIKLLYFKYLKGKDGVPLLSTARGYMMDGELVRKDNKNRDKALSVDLLYSAMPSLTSASTSFDLQSNIEHLRMCRERLTGTKLTPQQLENATRFLEEFYRPRQAEPKQEDGLTDKEFEAAMKLLIFSGETPAFDVFGANAAKEVQKLRNLVKVSTRTDESGDAALYDDLMKTAEKNYRASIRRTIRGWIVSARERGVKHFISGAMGCGFFKNDPAVVAQIVAEEFVDHGGDMEFVFAQYNAKEPNVGLRNAFEKAFDKAWETREVRHKQLQQGIEPEDVSVTEAA